MVLKARFSSYFPVFLELTQNNSTLCPEQENPADVSPSDFDYLTYIIKCCSRQASDVVFPEENNHHDESDS